VVCRLALGEEINSADPDENRIEDYAAHQNSLLLIRRAILPELFTPMSAAQVAQLAVKHDLIVVSDEIYGRIIYGKITFD